MPPQDHEPPRRATAGQPSPPSPAAAGGSPAPLLHLAAVNLRRGGRRLLDDIHWTVLPGETWVMLGANGSGKTSLLQLVCGYQPATSGRIELLGHRFGRTDWRDLRRRIGWVSSSLQSRIPDEESGLETVLSGAEAVIGWNRGRDHVNRPAALELMREFGCLHLADSRWSWLSQGERQRILFTRAWFAGPDVLFLDEPCAGLDPVAREDFLAWLDRLLSRATPSPAAATGAADRSQSIHADAPDQTTAAPATVLVTHHIEEITPAFTHLLALRQGRVLASGAINAALTDTTLSATYGRPCRIENLPDNSRRLQWLPANGRS